MHNRQASPSATVKARSWQSRLGWVWSCGEAPGLPYLAALTLISGARLSAAATALYGAAAVVCGLWVIELPLVACLMRPEPTRHHLGQLDRWARDHGRRLLAALLAGVGALLAVAGVNTLL